MAQQVEKALYALINNRRWTYSMCNVIPAHVTVSLIRSSDFRSRTHIKAQGLGCKTQNNIRWSTGSNNSKSSDWSPFNASYRHKFHECCYTLNMCSFLYCLGKTFHNFHCGYITEDNLRLTDEGFSPQTYLCAYFKSTAQTERVRLLI